jgi:hypothetical protein
MDPEVRLELWIVGKFTGSEELLEGACQEICILGGLQLLGFP